MKTAMNALATLREMLQCICDKCKLKYVLCIPFIKINLRHFAHLQFKSLSHILSFKFKDLTITIPPTHIGCKVSALS